MKKNIMIKTAIAGAIVAATTATTIADTKLYGRFRAGLVCTDNGTDTDCGLENRSSRFGIKVNQEISDGLTAFGKYEFGVNLDEGALSNGEQTNRLAYVGLKGGFGEVSIGSRWSPMYSYVMSPVDPFQLLGGTSGNTGYNSTYRRADTVNYKNKFGTTGMHVQLVMDDKDADNDAVDELQVGAGFKAGPVNLGLAYRDVTDGDSQIGLHAGGKFGMVKLGGGRGVNLSVHTDDSDNEGLIVSAEYEHKLSKNFRWFAAVQNADDGNDATDDVLKYGAETTYKVKSTDNLNRIIERNYQNSDLTRAQLLIGVLAKNPDAFRGGNINYLQRGKNLILPDDSEIETLTDEEAKEVLATHSSYFRKGRTGDFGSPIAGGYLVSKSKKTSAKIENKQVLQTIKIDQLEKESEDLRKRLERLIAEKNESDAKLRQVEKDLQNTLSANASSPSSNVDPISDEDKKKLSKQQKDKIDSFQTINTQGSNSIGQELNSQASTKQSEVTPRGGQLPLLQYQLPILALLLSIFAWIFWNKNKKNRLIAKEANIQSEVEKAYLDDEDFLNQQPEEIPIENTVKFDMAKAYIESGDVESAKDILHRLINEGNKAQREQAQSLLNTL
ncbi:hypothetical protein GQR58_020406 [Nymphon striatum]|nr:hypothetical protein GQR58_020406 [Nymphon striatum]